MGVAHSYCNKALVELMNIPQISSGQYIFIVISGHTKGTMPTTTWSSSGHKYCYGVELIRTLQQVPTTQTIVSVSISTLLYIQYSYLHNKSPPSFYMHMWQSWIELQILVYREFQVYSTGLIGATLMYYIFMFLKSMYEPHP